MCTVTIIPLEGGGLRLVSNRDELRTRPQADTPVIRQIERGIDAAWPTDTLAGGSWIGAGAHGLALTLLNGNPTPPAPLPPRSELTSRGTLIPRLLSAPSAREAIGRLKEEDLERFAPFRLVGADASGVVDAVWTRSELRVSERSLSPACFVSSGLGDALVAVRLELFDSWFQDRAVDAGSQDEFHAHRWDDRPELSVMMSRADARTVSVTSVEIDAECSVTMRYRDVDSHRDEVHLELENAPSSVAGA